MEEIGGVDDALAEMLVNERIEGKSFGEISRKHGIPTEEVIVLYRAYVMANTIRDPLEHRLLLQLRLERVINKLWDGLDAGSFKHGEAILKAVTQLQELHDLNEKTIDMQVNVIMDEDAQQVFDVLKRANNKMLDKVLRLPLSQKAKNELAAWPEWAAETSTEAVEEVIYAEVIDD